MKKLSILTLVKILFLTSTSFAWISTPSSIQSYNFKFDLNGHKWDYKVEASTQTEALEIAALACKNHYGGYKGMPEESMLDLIDTCTNPKSI